MSPTVDELIAAFRTVDPQAPDQQWQAAIDLGKLSDPADRAKAVPVLMEAMGMLSYDALARSHAAESLGNLGAPQAVPALITALSDPYRLTRSYAARALGKLGDAQAIDPLLKIMQTDDFFGARAEAAEALGKLCEGHDTEQCGEVRRALVTQKQIEQERKQKGLEEGRGERVASEVDRALKRLGELLEEVETQARAIQSAARRGDFGEVKKRAAALRNTVREARTVMMHFQS